MNVDDILPYDRNPRQVENQVYAELHESIRVVGLDAPIAITRRPSEEKYRVAAGGNTRLAVVKALWASSRDERFRRVPCRFRPWTSELDVLAAHLRENGLRDGLVFIDHALAIMDLKCLVEADEGGPIRVSRLESRLKQLGHAVSRRDLARMAYAVEVLQASVPVALRAGLGPWTVDKLHLLQRRYEAYFTEKVVPLRNDCPPFRSLFQSVLTSYDGESLDMDGLRGSLDEAIAELAGISSHKVRLGVEACLTLRQEFEGEGSEVHGEAGHGGGKPFGKAFEPGMAAVIEKQALAFDEEVEIPPVSHSSNLAIHAGDFASTAKTVTSISRSEPWRASLDRQGRAGELAQAVQEPSLERQDSVAVPHYPAAELRDSLPTHSHSDEALPAPATLTKVDPQSSQRMPDWAARVAASAGIEPFVAQDGSHALGLSLLPLPEGVSELQTVSWWFLAALSGFPLSAAPSAYPELIASLLALARATGDKALDESGRPAHGAA